METGKENATITPALGEENRNGKRYDYSSTYEGNGNGKRYDFSSTCEGVRSGKRYDYSSTSDGNRKGKRYDCSSTGMGKRNGKRYDNNTQEILAFSYHSTRTHARVIVPFFINYPL